MAVPLSEQGLRRGLGATSRLQATSRDREPVARNQERRAAVWAASQTTPGARAIMNREEKGQTRVELTLDRTHPPVPHGLSFPLDQRDIELKELGGSARRRRASKKPTSRRK